MTRLVPEHFAPGGRPKAAYLSAEAAIAARDSKALKAYQCGLCGKWHLGHSRR